jgi:hypothetical protein
MPIEAFPKPKPLARLLRGLALAASLGLAFFLVVRAQRPAVAETTAPTAPSSPADPAPPAVDVVADPLTSSAEEEPQFDFITIQNEFLWSSKNPVITPRVLTEPPSGIGAQLQEAYFEPPVPDEELFLHGSKSLRMELKPTKP